MLTWSVRYANVQNFAQTDNLIPGLHYLGYGGAKVPKVHVI